MKILLAFLMLAAASPARAGLYYDLQQSASSATMKLGGVMKLGSTTALAPSITLDGATGNITANNLANNARSYGAKGNGTTDDTSAINTCIANNYSCYIPAGSYKITSSVLVSAKAGFDLTGDGPASVIINSAPANNPSLAILNSYHFNVRGLAFAGVAGKVNDAIRVSTSAFGYIDDIWALPNGNGIEIRFSNTFTINKFNYWPSGGLNFPSAADGGARMYGVLVDSTIAGNYINQLAILNGNFSGTDPNVSSATFVKVGGAAASNSNIILSNNEMEGTQTHGYTMGIDIQRAQNVHIVDNYISNSSVTLTDCIDSLVENNFDIAQLWFHTTANTPGTSRNLVMRGGGNYQATGTLKIDAGCIFCGARDAFTQKIVDSGTQSFFENVITQLQNFHTLPFLDVGYAAAGVPTTYPLDVNGTIHSAYGIAATSATFEGGPVAVNHFTSGNGFTMNYGNATGIVRFINLQGNNYAGAWLGANLVDNSNEDLLLSSGGGTPNLVIYRNGNVGVGVSAPTVALDVAGAGVFSSSITGTHFGDGSHLTGISGGGSETNTYTSSKTFTSGLLVKQALATSGTPISILKIVGAAHTGLAAAEATDVLIDLSRTVTFDGTGTPTISQQRAIRILAPNYNGSGGIPIISSAATVAISGAPTLNGSGLQNALALSIESGDVKLSSGNLTIVTAIGQNNPITGTADVDDSAFMGMSNPNAGTGALSGFTAENGAHGLYLIQTGVNETGLGSPDTAMIGTDSPGGLILASGFTPTIIVDDRQRVGIGVFPPTTGLDVIGGTQVDTMTVSGAGIAFVVSSSASIAGQLYIGEAVTTNACGAGVTTCTASCPVNTQATGSAGCSTAAVLGVSVFSGEACTTAGCTCTTISATTITERVFCGRVNN